MVDNLDFVSEPLCGSQIDSVSMPVPHGSYEILAQRYDVFTLVNYLT